MKKVGGRRLAMIGSLASVALLLTGTGLASAAPADEAEGDGDFAVSEELMPAPEGSPAASAEELAPTI